MPFFSNGETQVKAFKMHKQALNMKEEEKCTKYKDYSLRSCSRLTIMFLKRHIM